MKTRWNRDILYIEDDEGKVFVTINVGNESNPLDTSIAHIVIHPKFWESRYRATEVRWDEAMVYIRLNKEPNVKN